MDQKFTLREKIEREKSEYYGKPDFYWKEEGLPWAIQAYHSGVGSVMDFTKDDWRVCKENGWMLDEVLELCDENLLCGFAALLDSVTKEDAISAVKNFYIWKHDLLPVVEEIYNNG